MKILINQHKKHLNRNDVMIIIFLIGLTIGVVFANVFRRLYISEVNIINDFFVNKLLNVNIDYSSLLKFVVLKRFKYYIAIWILSITVLGLPTIFFYSTYCGFMVGFIMSISIMKYGITGIILFLAYIFPQGLIYIPVIVITLMKTYSMCYRMHYNKTGMVTGKKSIILEYLLIIIILAVLIFIGCIMETYINPNVLQGFLKIL